MSHLLESTINHFLSIHLNQNKPFLLALSGGPDSFALFHALLHCEGLKFHVAHIDHGWRAESHSEAQQLQELAKQHGLPFHLKKIDPKMLTGNLEAASRQERLNFFKAISQQFNCQAVMLAHHADDQAETILKEVFEGKSWPYGMSETSHFEDLTLWRPFLKIRKEKILQYLEEKNLVPFDDYTNRDPKFLRARFRTSMIPQLTAEFGKEIHDSILKIGHDTWEWRNYLDRKVAPYLQKMQKGKLGLYLDAFPEEMVELQHLIRCLAHQENISLSRESIATIADMLKIQAADKKVNQFYLDRGRLFLQTKPFQPSIETIPLPQNGSTHYGSWQIRVSPSLSNDLSPSWQDVWNGRFQFSIPQGSYFIGPASSHSDYQDPAGYHCNINKLWTNYKVPAFLRNLVPVVWNKETILREFLSGKKERPPCVTNALRIEFEFVS